VINYTFLFGCIAAAVQSWVLTLTMLVFARDAPHGPKLNKNELLRTLATSTGLGILIAFVFQPLTEDSMCALRCAMCLSLYQYSSTLAANDTATAKTSRTTSGALTQISASLAALLQRFITTSI
jgi:hypothetical protein